MHVQAMTIGVALPDWIFASDRRTAPLVLLGLVFLGLAIPILIISWFLHSTEGYVGANRVMETTIVMYTRYCIKEALRLTKMPEAIVPANEFMLIPMKRETVSRSASCHTDHRLPLITENWGPCLRRDHAIAVGCRCQR